MSREEAKVRVHEAEGGMSRVLFVAALVMVVVQFFT